MSDEQLMVLVKAGQLDKMSLLFERYKKPLYAFFYRMNYNQSLSEDLTQTVFERVIRYRKSFNENRAFKSWIFQIARNAKTDHYRQHKLKYANEIDWQQLGEQDEKIRSDTAMAQQLQDLDLAMTKLSAEQRELLVLTRFQKMKYADVAVIMESTEGAIKVKVHRAMQKLKQVFFKYHDKE